MIDAYPQEIALVSRTLKSIHEAFEWLHSKKVNRRWQLLVVTLAAKSFNSLLVAHDALLNGYPEQALILARTLAARISCAMRREGSCSHCWLSPLVDWCSL